MLKHVCIAIIPKMEPMKTDRTNDVMMPYGGRFWKQWEYNFWTQILAYCKVKSHQHAVFQLENFVLH